MPNHISMSQVSTSILCIGVPEYVQAIIDVQAKDCRVLKIDYSSEILDSPVADIPAIIFCGPCKTMALSPVEVVQSLRMIYTAIPIYLVTYDRLDLKIRSLKKNGFTDGFLFPNEEMGLIKALRRDLSNVTSGRIKAFRKVQLIDLDPEVELGFDLYIHLPANNRRIRYVSKSEAIGVDRAKKLQKRSQSVLVTEDQVKDFYQFTARQLKKLGSETGTSQTELVEKREKAVRDLLAGMFSSNGQGHIEDGREVMDDCQEIIKAYVLDDSKDTNSWYERLIEIASSNAENSAYSRAANTSTFAALLSIALGIGDPKDTALAGILHDIGLVTIPSEICQKDLSTLTPEELKIYQEHPMASVHLIKERRMNVSEKVCSIIEQHHERFDGNGYPKKLPGPRIAPESQILAIADLLTELTEVKDGFPQVSVKDAIDTICKEGQKNPLESAINPELLRKLKLVFSKKE